MMRASLMAIREHCRALIELVDGALAEPVATVADPAECIHPLSARRAVPRMGHPAAWLCACGRHGDD